jgi:hypothetical protein
LIVFIIQGYSPELAVKRTQMEVSGHSEKSREFLSNLDPKKLVDLTVDILALQGHIDIKSVDGPGRKGLLRISAAEQP